MPETFSDTITQNTDYEYRLDVNPDIYWSSTAPAFDTSLQVRPLHATALELSWDMPEGLEALIVRRNDRYAKSVDDGLVRYR